MLLLGVTDGLELSAKHINVGILHHLCVTLFVFQGEGSGLLRLVAQISDGDFVTRTLLGDDACQVAELRHFLSIDMCDDIAFLQTGIGGSTVFDNLGNIDTLHRAEIHLVAFFLLTVHIGADILSLDTNHGTLHGTVLLDIVDDLVHDRCRDSETIADIGTRLGIDHGIDADKGTVGVDKRTTRVALVDGGIRLNHGSHFARLLHTAGLCRYDTGSDCIVESEGITYSEHPFTNLYIVGVGNLDSRQILAINLDQCQVCGGIGTNNAGGELLIVIESHQQFISTIHHMVVGDDIAVGRDDDTRACCYTLRCLYLTLTASAIALSLSTSEESAKRIGEEVFEGIRILDSLYF